jgi:hypothetical protein
MSISSLLALGKTEAELLEVTERARELARAGGIPDYVHVTVTKAAASLEAVGKKAVLDQESKLVRAARQS